MQILYNNDIFMAKLQLAPNVAKVQLLLWSNTQPTTPS